MSCPLLMHLKSFTLCSICCKLRQRYASRKDTAADPPAENPSPPGTSNSNGEPQPEPCGATANEQNGNGRRYASFEEPWEKDEWKSAIGNFRERMVRESKLDFKVRVKNPKNLRLNLDSYDEMVTYYDILLKSKERCFRVERSRTQRRYSDFEWLRNRLYDSDKFRAPPELPPKYVLSRFDKAVIEERVKGLEEWLRKILRDPFYLSDIAVHLFVQTELTVDEIKRYLDGDLPEEVVEAIWHNGGRKDDSQYTYEEPVHHFIEPEQWDPEFIECTPEEREQFVNQDPVDVDHDLVPPPPGVADIGDGARFDDDTPDSGYIPSDDASVQQRQETVVAEVHAGNTDGQSVDSFGQDFVQNAEARSPSLVGQCGSINADLEEPEK